MPFRLETAEQEGVKPPPPPPPAESSLCLPASMEQVLRPHQVSALHFIWSRLVDHGFLDLALRSLSTSLEQRLLLYQELYGCILGHSMGLGKTLTAFCFVLLMQSLVSVQTHHTAADKEKAPSADSAPPRPANRCTHPTLRKIIALLRRRAASAGGTETNAPATAARSLRVLVIAPKSCVLHWYLTLQRWRAAGVAPADVDNSALPVLHLVHRSPPSTTLEAFYQHGGILLLSYEEYVTLTETYGGGITRRAAQQQVSALHYVASALDTLREPLPLLDPKCDGVPYKEMLEAADILILDEAHRLRRESSKIVMALRRHTHRVQLRLALTGTPIQNHLREYNLMQSLVTGCAVEGQMFSQLFIQPIARGQCVDSTYQQFSDMQECISALRRYFASTVHHVGPEVLEKELPPRHEFVLLFSLSPAQEEAYRTMLRSYGSDDRGRLLHAVDGGAALQLHHSASHIACHPAMSASRPLDAAQTGTKRQRSPPVSDSDGEEDTTAETLVGRGGPPALDAEALDISLSPKLQFTIELISHILFNLQEKVVLFSLYTTHLRLIAAVLQAKRRIHAPVFSGELSETERQRLIDALQRGVECRVLLCSLRAGGVGIDLVTANHCILFDVSWNPADDTQATFRVYRFGQVRPVNVYRLATAGTTEQVVFAYALQKSWLHKKIADVRDPTRQQRLRTMDYFRYPCELSLHTPAAVKRINATVTDQAERERQRAAYFLDWCERRCGPIAHVLHLAPALQRCLVNLFQHAFLLRDDSADIIHDMEKRFDVPWQRVKTLGHHPPRPVRAPVQPPSGASIPLSSPTAEKKSDAREMEKKLIQKAQRASVRLVCGALRHAPMSASAGTLGRGGAFEARDIVAMEAELTALLSPLLPAADDLPAPENLVDWFLQVYHLGVQTLLQEVLARPDAAPYRSLLSKLLPKEAGRQPATLRLELEHRPHRLLEGMTGVERMYLSTELGFPRPLVAHLFFLGIERLGRLIPAPQLAVHAPRFQQVLVLFGRRDVEEPRMVEEDHLRPAGQQPADTLLREALSCMLDCLGEAWPPYIGFRQPRVPFRLGPEEGWTARALDCSRHIGRLDHPDLYRESEVAHLLRLQKSREGVYCCPRCGAAALVYVSHPPRAVPDWCCSPCHYSASSTLKLSERTHHHVTLYQLSAVCNLVDAFCVSVSFRRGFQLEGCTTVLDALRRQTSAAPVFDFVPKCLVAGTEAIGRELPPELMHLLVVQTGAKDAGHLAQLLHANARLLWSKNVKPNLRRSVLDAFRNLIGPTQLFTSAAMPVLLIVLALHTAVRHEGRTYACELLHGTTDGEGDELASGSSRGLICPSASSRQTLLRFVCDALVKLLYVEKLLARKEAETEGLTVAALQRQAENKKGEQLSGGAGHSRSLCSTPTSELTFASSASGSVLRGDEMPVGGAELVPAVGSDALRGLERQRGNGDSLSSDEMGEGSFFGSCYSSDRPSFDSGDDAEGADQSSRSSSSSSSTSSSSTRAWQGAARTRTRTDIDIDIDIDAAMEGGARTPPDLRTELVAEEELQQLASEYWIALCEVYGTVQASGMKVLVETSRGAIRVIEPPPTRLWRPHEATAEGLTCAAAVDSLLSKVVALSDGIRIL